jgi:8-oxo-dGTP pyrophosphatase MutT (NUDIX family)
MRKAWLIIGRLGYWVGYPFIMLYLRGTTRTRVVVRQGNKVLLVKSWLSDGAWELPGGGVHRGEEVITGALRELYEETGITLKSRSLKKLETRTVRGSIVHFETICFGATLSHESPLRLHRFEIADACWASRRQLKSMKLADGVIESVQRCFKT